MNNLTQLSPLDGRYQEKIAPLQAIFSEYGLIKFRIIVEITWLKALASFAKLPELPALNEAAKKTLQQLVDHFSLADAERVKTIESTTRHDVKAVEYFIKERIGQEPSLAAFCEFIHFGCTSEDVNNLAYGLMLKTARETCLLPRLQTLLTVLKKMAGDYAMLPMLARTHGQPATPTTLGKELANVVARLQRQMEQLENISILGKMNGASGNYNALHVTYPDIAWPEVSRHFVEALGLTFNPYTTQIEPHDTLSEFFAILLRINVILIDFNRDIWAYISIAYFKQKALANEVGSSVMPHKINPIDFENAEGNLGIANALFEHMMLKLPISRWQRDLSDSTVLRNIGVAIGHSDLAYQATLQGLAKLTPNTEVMRADLESHWEVLAEPIQTVMRRFQLEAPYEQLKALTRGQTIDKETLRQFISGLSLSEEAKKRLLQLTPENYLGYAVALAKEMSETT